MAHNHGRSPRNFDLSLNEVTWPPEWPPGPFEVFEKFSSSEPLYGIEP
jgi:hypothetical protein